MRKQISGATRHLGYKNIHNGYMEVKKNKDKVDLFLTTTPLSDGGEMMTSFDMIDGTKNYKYMQEPYTNQFLISFTKKDILELQYLINRRVKQLKLSDALLGSDE